MNDTTESPVTLDFEVEGMSCASCVGRVEKSLAAVPGVSQAAVNLASEKAAVTGTATAPALAAALEAAGYPARTQSWRFAVQEMSCASCVSRVEKALRAIPGVLEASVNLAAETAEVIALAGAVSPAIISAATARAGYPASFADDQETRHVDRKAEEAAGLARLTMIALALTLPVFVLEMGGHVFPAFARFIADSIGTTTSWFIQFVLTSLVLAWPGRTFLRRGLPALAKGTPDMNSLVAIGTLAAWSFSTVALFLPEVLPAQARAVYFEAAAVIVTLILLGRFLEARAKGRTGQAIRKLIGLQPKTARVERDNQIQDLPVAQITVGDIVHVRPGENLAVDGTVLDGSSYVNESMISGESVPVLKQAGATVVGGTVNGTGALRFQATHVGSDTMLAQIIRMVEQAQSARLPIQDLVNTITAWFVPTVLLAALLTITAWLFLGPQPALTYALVSGVSVLIIACPCAMGLATPTSIMVGTGRAAELGVLFRKGAALQTLHEASVVAVDKTGTLTAGEPALTDIHVAASADGLDENEILRLVAAVENTSEHPIAQALVRAAQERGLEVPPATGFESITGMGVRAQVLGREVMVGADRLLASAGMSDDALLEHGRRLGAQGKTPLYAAIDGRAVAAFGVADPIKPGTREAIDALHAMGLTVAMVTGDNEATARHIADQLGIDRVLAEVLPAGKVEAVNTLRADGAKLAFVGDGINDAPALASADVGIAIGTGTDMAIESADVVLISGDLRGVVNAFEISRQTMRNIRQNLFWAFGYNGLLIPVAAGALYPLNGTLLSPMLAAGAMALSSVFVLTNALRLRWVRAALPEPTDPRAAGSPPRPAAQAAHQS